MKISGKNFKELMTCPECGELFISSGVAMYCSPLCKEKHLSKELEKSKIRKNKTKISKSEIDRRIKQREKIELNNKHKTDKYSRICLICGKEFTPRNDWHVYCSPECRELIDYDSSDAEKGRFLILNRDEFRCVYCGKSSIEDKRELHVDHIIPRNSGGESIASNLVTACRRCNLEKSAMVLDLEIQERILNIINKRNKKAGIHNNKRIKLSSDD